MQKMTSISNFQKQQLDGKEHTWDGLPLLGRKIKLLINKGDILTQVLNVSLKTSIMVWLKRRINMQYGTARDINIRKDFLEWNKTPTQGKEHFKIWIPIFLLTKWQGKRRNHCMAIHWT